MVDEYEGRGSGVLRPPIIDTMGGVLTPAEALRIANYCRELGDPSSDASVNMREVLEGARRAGEELMRMTRISYEDMRKPMTI